MEEGNKHRKPRRSIRKGQKSIRLEVPAATSRAIDVYCARHGCSIQAAIRRILHDALNVDGGAAGNA